MQMAELKTIEEFNDLKPILWGICQFETMDDHKSYKETGLFLTQCLYYTYVYLLD